MKSRRDGIRDTPDSATLHPGYIAYIARSATGEQQDFGAEYEDGREAPHRAFGNCPVKFLCRISEDYGADHQNECNDEQKW